MASKPIYIFKLNDKEVHREEGYMVNIYPGRRIKDQKDTVYTIKIFDHDIKTNVFTCTLAPVSEKTLAKEKVLLDAYEKKTKEKQGKFEVSKGTGKIIIQVRERLPEKNNKWSNWLNNTPCNTFEDAESLLEEFKKTETDSLQFRICDKNHKEETSVENEITKEEVILKEEIIEEPKEEISEVVEKPFIIQYKERNKDTGVFGSWKLLERFETDKQRNDYYGQMVRDNNRIYTIKNVRITRQHLNKLLGE